MTSLIERLTKGPLKNRIPALRDVQATDDARLPEALITLAEEPSIGGRDLEAVAAALGRTQHPLAWQYLATRLASEEASDREFAALGLGCWGTAESVAALIALLQDDVNSVRNIAERALMQSLDATRRYGVDQLLQLLDHPVPLTRSPAARLLGLVQEPRALEPLLRQLQTDRQWLGRLWAAKGLGDLGNQEAVEPLVQAMRQDEKNRVRAASVEALARLRPPHVVALMLEAQQDEDGGVRRLAEEWLQKLKQETLEQEPSQ